MEVDKDGWVHFTIKRNPEDLIITTWEKDEDSQWWMVTMKNGEVVSRVKSDKIRM